MKRVFKYGRMDRRARRITTISIAVLALAGLLCLILYFWGAGSYAMAWFVSLAVAVIGLFVLSIPRSIELTYRALEIKCLVEVTYIPIPNIRSARRVGRGDVKGMVCLLGSWGFFGYFGIYLDLRRMEFVRFYCTEWDNFVEITDIYEKRYYVSCARAEELVSGIADAARPHYGDRREPQRQA